VFNGDLPHKSNDKLVLLISFSLTVIAGLIGGKLSGLESLEPVLVKRTIKSVTAIPVYKHIVANLLFSIFLTTHKKRPMAVRYHGSLL
jgi:hypothetical protein